MAQEGAQGRGGGHVDLGELGGRHLGPGTLAEVDGAQGQRQSPQAAALRQFPYERRDGEKQDLKAAAGKVSSPAVTRSGRKNSSFSSSGFLQLPTSRLSGTDM